MAWIVLTGMLLLTDIQKLSSLLDGASGPHIVTFLIDGMSQSTFQKLLANGKLPYTQHYFSQNTISAETAVASIPAETMTNLAGILTGRLAGHHGIIGGRWRSPPRLVERRYEYRLRDLAFGSAAGKFRVNRDLLVPTIFEISKPLETASVLSWVSGGSTLRVDPIRGLVWHKLMGSGDLDDMAVDGFRSIVDEAIDRQKFPVFTFVHMIEVDRTGHRNGTGSGHYEDAIIRADRHIGKILTMFEQAGVLDRVYWVLTSDHGMVDLRSHVSPSRLLEKKLGAAGYRLSVAADRFVQVYRRKPDFALSEKVMATLAREESVHVVAARAPEPNRFLIVSRHGKAAIEADGTYNVLSGEDPLCRAKPCGPISDAAYQIRILFQNNRTGDLLIFAAEGWTFREGNRGGHGGLQEDELSVPLLVRGPGVPSKIIPFTRTIDLMPSLLELLGTSQSKIPTDGRSFLNRSPNR